MLTSIYDESLLNFHLFNVKIVSFSQLNDFISFFSFPGIFEHAASEYQYGGQIFVH